ncbi:MAG TPA: hypothetical protein VIJ68_03410 [Candidatus Saccharimonadales bacterium]
MSLLVGPEIAHGLSSLALHDTSAPSGVPPPPDMRLREHGGLEANTFYRNVSGA